jgi:hypothetical protein
MASLHEKADLVAARLARIEGALFGADFDSAQEQIILSVGRDELKIIYGLVGEALEEAKAEYGQRFFRMSAEERDPCRKKMLVFEQTVCRFRAIIARALEKK